MSFYFLRKENVIEVYLVLLRPYSKNCAVIGVTFHFICFALIQITINILEEVK